MKPKKPKKSGKKTGKRTRSVRRTPPPSAPPEPVSEVEIPPLLLEGDEEPAPTRSGPGERYVVAPEPVAPPVPPAQQSEAGLPEAYGTQRVFLAARDPHWLYVHWDLTTEQLQGYNAEAADGHLTLRIHKHQPGAHPVSVIELHPDSRFWFVPVEEAGVAYVAELGFYHRWGGRWTTIGTSDPIRTPRVGLAPEEPVQFKTMATEVPTTPEAEAAAPEAVPQPSPWTSVPGLRERTEAPLTQPARAEGPRRELSPRQQEGLADLIQEEAAQAVPAGSLEVTQWGRVFQPRPPEALELPEAWSGAISSAAAVPEVPSQAGFWFNINAELVIYGATEPNATVQLAGRQIRLRPDGTFTYRFALPDGVYELAAVALSPDGTQHRAAKLSFRRQTEYRGDVSAHPQEPGLSAPPKPAGS